MVRSRCVLDVHDHSKVKRLTSLHPHFALESTLRFTLILRWTVRPLVAGRPHDEYTRRRALEALLASIDEEDTEIYNRTRDLFEDPDEWP